MNFNQYQELASTTSLDTTIGHPIIYPILGLVGEAGEIAEKAKKLFRDDNGILTKERKAIIKKELGDVLWYIAEICTRMEIDMHDVAKDNIEKLLSRKTRGTLRGDGDNR